VFYVWGGGVFDHAKKGRKKEGKKEEFTACKKDSTTHLFLVLGLVWYPKR
jgi:hypothetical protein